jgi:hypothetical protein
MDPNLYCPIINATLNQPPGNPLLNAGVLALIGVFMGWGLNYFAYSQQEKRKSMKDLIQEQKQVYSQLRGIIDLLHQIHVIQGIALATTFWVLSRERLDLPETEYGSSEINKQKVDEGSLEIARSSQRLWEIIGLIQVTFHDKNIKIAIDFLTMCPTNLGKIQADYKRKFKEVKSDQKNLLDEEGEGALFKKANEDFGKAITRAFDGPAGQLCRLLEREIETGENNLAKPSWWKFWRRD